MIVGSVCPDDPTEIGRAKGCDGCPGQTYCSRVSLEQRTNQSDEFSEGLQCRMAVIKHKIIVMSGKGGVGKSTVASQLALGLATKGLKVAVLDLDLCGPSIPKIFGCSDGSVYSESWGWIPVTTQNGVSLMSVGFLNQGKDTPVMWRGPRKTQMVKRFLRDTYWGQLDYLIIDTPPGTSDEHMSVVAALTGSTKIDGALLVTTPQEICVTVMSKQIDFARKLKLPILGLVMNMAGFVCPCCNEVYQLFDSKLSGSDTIHGLPLASKIPVDPVVSNSMDKGVSIFEYLKEQPEDGGSPTLKAFRNLVNWVQQKLEQEIQKHQEQENSAEATPPIREDTRNLDQVLDYEDYSLDSNSSRSHSHSHSNSSRNTRNNNYKARTSWDDW